MKKKTIIIIGIVVAVLVIALVAAMVIPSIASSGSGADEDNVPVTKVSNSQFSDKQISNSRYGGIVEMDETVSVKKDSNKTINKTFVKEGDTVKKGDKLFEYDVEQMKLQLSKSQLELDQAKAKIVNDKDQLSTLESQRSSATDQNAKLEIDNQILDLQLEIKENEFTVSSKQDEVDKLNKSIENNVVKSEVDGKVQKIASLETDDVSTDRTYISIATNDDFRVKATVSELNINSFSEKSPIIIRSRNDESETWTGVVTSIDKSSPVPEEKENTEYPMMDGDSQDNSDSKASKYYMYIKIDNPKDLIVGQHVTVELDSEKAEETDGVFINAEYIVDIDAKPYVWCKGKNEKLEKRSVELGDLNESTGEYEILNGLTNDDYIAFPEGRFTEGMPVHIQEDESDATEVS